MFDSSDRNRSFADQLADSMSPDPARRSVCGSSMADTVSQSIANSLTGNYPGTDRFLDGNGSFADQMAQDLMDDTFVERRNR